MASTTSLCLLLCFISSLCIIPSSSNIVTLDLIPIVPKQDASLNPKDIISAIVESSLQRAYHMKHGKKLNNPSYTSPLFPRSFGGYSMALPLGTPVQRIPTLFDTGSSLVWVPCTSTSHYICYNCSETSPITTFKFNKSSSKKIITCNQPKCKWLDQPGLLASCPGCSRKVQGGCTMPCDYIQGYGGGDTYGFAVLETLHLQGKMFSDFLFGCSFMSDGQPEGIVGFGRSPTSVPSQLMLDRFAYCLVNHKFDDKPRSSSLILGNSRQVPGIRYTPLLKNPTMFPYNLYYYVQLDEITVGKKLIKVPSNVTVPSKDGNGGTIVDSGSTLTAMTPSIFDPLVKAFVSEMSRTQQKRATIEQFPSGNLLCFNVTGERRVVPMPQVVFHFKGGASMELPVAKYFNPIKNIECLPFVNASFQVGQGGGPAVILGNYQQQNHYLEYDLVNERLGIKAQIVNECEHFL